MSDEAAPTVKLDEPVLDDSYPVYFDYLYVADGEVVSSNIEGTVRRLKARLGAREIRRCDAVGRIALRMPNHKA